MPFLDSQVKGDLTSTESIKVFSILETISSSISFPPSKITSFEDGSIISFRATLPKILSPRVSTISSFFFRAVTSIPLNVPQSCSFTITSCDTSTNLLVRYPAFAVLSAVSAKPFLAP